MVSLRSSALFFTLTSGSCFGLCVATSLQGAHAQVVPSPNDAQTQVTQTGNQIQINGGTASGDGQNLFHSFSQFDVPSGSTATFVVGGDINTVLGRVTGGFASVIDGQVLVTGANTNLILMNPAGMLFGPNSSVSVPGSFTATTASGVQLGDRWWNGIGLNDYQALNGAPSSLAFTALNPGALVSSGNLVAGGDVLLSGGVTAVTGTVSSLGTIAIASVPGRQQLTLSAPGSPLSLNIAPLTASPNSLLFQPADLPALLTGRTDTTAIGLVPNGDGSVTLVARNTRLNLSPGTSIVSGELTGDAVRILGTSTVDVRGNQRMGDCDPAVQNCDDPPAGGGADPDDPPAGGGGTDPNDPPPNGGGGTDPNDPPSGGGGTDPNNPPPGGADPGDPPAGGGADPNDPPPDQGMFPGDNLPASGEGQPPADDPGVNPGANGPGPELDAPEGGPVADNGALGQGDLPLEEPLSGNGGEPGEVALGPDLGPMDNDREDMDDREDMEGVSEPRDGEPQIGNPDEPVMMALPQELEGNPNLEGEVLDRLNNQGQPETELLRAIAGAEGDFDESLSAPSEGRVSTEGPARLGNEFDVDPSSIDGGQLDGLGDQGILAMEDSLGAEPGAGLEGQPRGSGSFEGPLEGPLEPPPQELPPESGGELGDLAAAEEGPLGDRRSLRGDGGDFEAEGLSNGEAIALGNVGLNANDLAALNQGDWQVGSEASSAFGAGDFDDGIGLVEQAWDRQFDNYGLDQTTVQTLSSTSIRDNLSVIAEQTGDRSALVYVMLQPTGLELVMIGPEGNPIFRRIRGVSRDDVLKTAFQFRETITNPVLRRSEVYKQPAQKLYNWIVRPLLQDLEKQNISTLLFAPDAGLRSLPFAALHDGETFLVERFSLGVTPSINLTDTKYVDLRSAPVLAMGASEFGEGLSPLPAVPVELESIAGTERTTEILLNDEFTVDQLRSVRDRNPAPIVHLATHGEFQSGSLDNSFIQFWGDERLTLDRLRELQFNSPQVELLILSACRTAVGDPNAELGFAGVSVHAGVKSTLASVWYVADAGTLALMDQFYDALGNVSTKSQSLRQAQLALLRGDVRLEAGALRTRGKRAINLPAESLELLDSGTDLSHPYYWAGFTLIGSPW
ncbi:MAG: CHAT domain-containing protein [Cyanobacteria bacterium P01_C01_bin.89]